MKIELRALALANAPIAGLVGTRVDWNILPQGAALPALILRGVNGDPDYAMAGPTGLCESFVIAESWGETYAAADAVTRAVEALFSGFRQPRGMFRGVFVESERDGSEFVQPALFQCISLDLRIWHTPA